MIACLFPREGEGGGGRYSEVKRIGMTVGNPKKLP